MKDNKQHQNYFSRKLKNTSIIRKVSIISLIINLMLAVLKAVFGIMFKNLSIISDSIHSLSDSGLTLLLLFAVFISRPQADKTHNYGHEKIEPLIILFFALILSATGVMLVIQGISGLILPKATSGLNYYLLAITIISILSKEFLYRLAMHYAKITHSDILRADAWHHRTDSFSSFAVFAGLIFGIFIKTDLIESIAILVVSALIIKMAMQILISSINQLIDKAADKNTSDKLEQIIKETEGVASVDSLRTRLFGNAICADIEIGIDSSLNVEQSYNIVRSIKDKIESQKSFLIKYCHIHVNPAHDADLYKRPEDLQN